MYIHPEQKEPEAFFANLNQCEISQMTKNPMWSYVRTGDVARIVCGSQTNKPVPYNDVASPEEKIYPVFVLKTEFDKYVDYSKKDIKK